jgi:hypothetical protein
MENLHGRKSQIMINWLVGRIFSWDRLRDAVTDEVRLYDSVLRSLRSNDWDRHPTNLSWTKNDLWYGWSYSPEKKRYYFDDLGSESLMDLWDYLGKREASNGHIG